MGSSSGTCKAIDFAPLYAAQRITPSKGPNINIIMPQQQCERAGYSPKAPMASNLSASWTLYDETHKSCRCCYKRQLHFILIIILAHATRGTRSSISLFPAHLAYHSNPALCESQHDPRSAAQVLLSDICVAQETRTHFRFLAPRTYDHRYHDTRLQARSVASRPSLSNPLDPPNAELIKRSMRQIRYLHIVIIHTHPNVARAQHDTCHVKGLGGSCTR